MKTVIEKELVIDKAYNDLIKGAKSIQTKVYNSIMSYFLSHTNQNPSTRTLSKINKELKSILNVKTFESATANYLKNFDNVENLSKLILEKENSIDLSHFNLSAEKKMMTEEVIDGILSKDMINAKFHQPLRRMLYQYTTTNVSLDMVEKELRGFILSNKKGAGFIEKHVRTIAVESLSRFDGMINQKVAKEYDLDAFRIVGGLIDTSEPQCVGMVNGTGELGAYMINRKYAMSDLPAIISKLRNHYKGVYEYLTPENYFIYRNHWGCRHTFIPSNLLKKDREALEKRNLN